MKFIFGTYLENSIGTYKNIIKTSTLSYTEKLTMCGEI